MSTFSSGINFRGQFYQTLFFFDQDNESLNPGVPYLSRGPTKKENPTQVKKGLTDVKIKDNRQVKKIHCKYLKSHVFESLNPGPT